MKFLRSLQLGLLHRRTLKALSAIDGRLAEQNGYLRRLADHFAPELPAEGVEPSFSVDHLNAAEAGIVLDYVERTRGDLGREPTEDEIMRYLADEKPIDLQQRLESEI